MLPAAQFAAVEQRHEPEAQLKPGGHARPQAPQLAGSVDVSMQPAGVSQQVWPAAQAAPPLHVHSELPPTAADWQYSPGRQTTAPPLPVGQLHRPLVRHAPPLLPERQRAFVPSQPQKLGVSWPQTSPFWAVQLLAQLPQFAEFILTSSSQPLSAVGNSGMEQLACPSMQVESQTPPVHDRDATIDVLHARPQPPQLRTSDAVFVSQPSSTAGRVALQLTKPTAQVGVHSPATHARVETCCVPHA